MIMDILEKIQEVNKFGLHHDHNNHTILFNAAKSIKNVDGIVCEIGLRAGGGLALMMLACIENDDKNRKFIGIDPYGNIEYHWKEDCFVKFDYTNEMKLNTISSLSKFCLQFGLDFDLYCMEDTEFFEKYKNGIPVYNQVKQIMNTYSLVHLDGPHAVSELQTELEFFKNKMSIGGIIVLDDVTGYYSLTDVETILLNDDSFINVENDGYKSSYKRVK